MRDDKKAVSRVDCSVEMWADVKDGSKAVWLAAKSAATTVGGMADC